MKSFKKMAAGVLSLVMLSSLATYAVAADADVVGNSIGSSTTVGDTTKGDSDDPNKGDSDDPNKGDSDDPNKGDSDGPNKGETDKDGNVIGDVNGDGEFNGLDLLLTKKAVLGLVTFTEDQEKAADVNDDGQFLGNDLLNMKKVMLGLTTFSEIRGK